MVDKYENFENIENVKEGNKKDKKKNIMNLIITIFLSLMIIIKLSWFGASLLFYKWASKKETKCNSGKTLFDVIFPNELSSNLGNSKAKEQMGGEMMNCIERNKNLDSICSSSSSGESKYKFNFKFPGLKEWSFKSLDNTNKTINSMIKAILDVLPDGDMCSITFLLGGLVIPFIYILVYPVAFVALLVNMFTQALEYKFYILLSVLILGLFLGYSYILPTIFSLIMPIFILIKLLFYPLASGGKDTLLKIVQMNMKIINIIILLTLTLVVGMMYSQFSKNVYIGIIIGFVPIFFIYLNNIFN
tara:strand:+ start:11778 stop:12686 length:909 start_codon:yes stop_codon:yes gene_type:complete